MRQLVRPAVSLFVALTLLTGVLYPLAVTVAGQALFPYQASGSLLVENGQLIGSDLIGQSFSKPGYFWSRPSATSPMPYNAANSGGANLGPLNPALLDAIKGRVAALRAAAPDNHRPIPVDLVTSSASGLDPHISVAAALYQLERVARARHLPTPLVRRLIAQHTEPAWLGLLGSDRVNVLALNLALDATAAP
jgi:K+-transporting ATPase ATPase C chain